MDPTLAPHKHSFLSQNVNTYQGLENQFLRRQLVLAANQYSWMALFDLQGVKTGHLIEAYIYMDKHVDPP